MRIRTLHTYKKFCATHRWGFPSRCVGVVWCVEAAEGMDLERGGEEGGRGGVWEWGQEGASRAGKMWIRCSIILFLFRWKFDELIYPRFKI